MSRYASRYTTITVPEEVFRRLSEIRREMGVRSWSEFLTILANTFVKCREEEKRASVRKIMCNDLGEASASLAGWVRKLRTVFNDKDNILIALEYLTHDPQDHDVMVVDKEKCMKG